MPKAVIAIPAFNQGISTQPQGLRYPGQMEDCVNFICTPDVGLEKAPPTYHLLQIPDDSNRWQPGVSYGSFKFIRDEDNKYLFVYGPYANPSEVSVLGYQIGGRECTVNITQDAQDYLDLGTTTAESFKFEPVGDAIYAANRTVAMGAQPATTYSVSGTVDEYDLLRLYTPTNDTYWRTQSGSTGFPAGFYHYDVGSATFATYRGPNMFGNRINPVYMGGPTIATDGTWSWKGAFTRVDLSQTNCSWDAATKVLTKAGAFAGWEPQQGEQLQVVAGTGFTTGSYADEIDRWHGVVKIDDDSVELPNTTVAGNQTDVEIGYSGYALEADNIDTGGNTADPITTMAEFAQRVQDAIRAAAPIGLDVLVYYNDQSSPPHFQITSPFRGAGATIVYPLDNDDNDGTTSGFPDGVSLAYQPEDIFGSGTGQASAAGTGTPAVDTATDFVLAVDDRWTAVAASGQANADIDETLMPHLLQLTTLAMPSAGAVFDMDEAVWKDRASGDQVTNPVPISIQKQDTCADLAVHRGRLFFGSGPRVFASQTNDFSNLYLQEVGNLKDDDRLDMPVDSGSNASVQLMFPWQRKLIIFTWGSGQSQITQPEALTPSTAALTSTTTYTTLDVEPAVMGRYAYALARKQCGTYVMEFSFVDDTSPTYAEPINIHADILPSSPKQIVGSANEGVLFVIDGTPSRTFYRGAQFWAGDQKVMNAWTKIQLQDKYKVVTGQAIDGYFYMLMEKSSGVFVWERMPIERESANCPLEDQWIGTTDVPGGGESDPGGGGGGGGVGTELDPCWSTGSGAGFDWQTNVYDASPRNVGYELKCDTAAPSYNAADYNEGDTVWTICESPGSAGCPDQGSGPPAHCGCARPWVVKDFGLGVGFSWYNLTPNTPYYVYDDGSYTVGN